MQLPDKDQILQELHQIDKSEKLQEFYSTYLGKQGSINGLFKTLKQATPDEKKKRWGEIQKLFKQVEDSFFKHQDHIQRQERSAQLRQEHIDGSTPWISPVRWYQNLQNQLRRRVEEVFAGMWFHISYGREYVSQYENFTSVNIPPTHPATEMHDTFYLKTTQKEEKLVLRTHTSAAQNELIQQLGVPCKFIVPGKVFRYENMDATHDCVFWQVEWVLIDQHISIGHFKGMMKEILEAILEQKVEMRLRPAYFPFVEPWFEIDALCTMGNKQQRMEILWAGMIHPNVLQEAKVDPTQRSGFAFGLWMSRLVALKYGITDIRLLTNGDLRFHETVNRHH